MTSAYRRDHATIGTDELGLLNTAARMNIVAAVTAFVVLYPAGDPPSSGETLALQRAFARYLVDSGKASENGALAV